MKAIQLHRTGGPDVLEMVDLALPEPQPGEVRVSARAIGAAMPDVLMRKGSYKWMPPLPAIPGNEMAGVIDAVGAGVTALRIGQRVLVSARELKYRGGCYAEAICVPEHAPFVLPEAIGFDDAVSLGNFQLALALFATVGAAPTRSILLPGAAGGVAIALAQVAKHRGLQVIGTASSEAKRDFASANGVDRIIVGKLHDFEERVVEITDGRGVDVAFDHIGGTVFMACLHALAPLGTLVSYNIVSGPPAGDVFAELRRLLTKSLAVRTFSIHTLDADTDRRRGLMNEAIALMAARRVRAPAASLFPLADARHVHKVLESGQSLGKIVLHV